MPLKPRGGARLPNSKPTLSYVPRQRAQDPQAESRKDSESRKLIPYLKARRLPLIASTVAGAAIVLYVGLVVNGFQSDIARSKELDVPSDTSDRYRFTASRFDNDVSNLEWIIGITRRRKELCAQARGHVLEVSAGTGRNSKFLPLLRGVKSVTLVDKTREMIDEARRKWPEDGNAWFIRTTFRVQDCREKVPCPSPAGFDTVIDTMGLCSTGEPEALLRNLAEMTNPDGGKILLLEHGKGHYAWMNRVLDATAPAHAQRHGCWYNKDIGEIVRKSGLVIEEQKRFNFGTTWWFVLRPAKPGLPSKTDGNEEPQPQKSRWFGWG
ncbi:MAG: hypothetical protein Q9162_007646 [Coniocarpon cinnabarinum]